MPIYEYICDECKKGFEQWERIFERKKPVCPHCKSEKVKRCLSAFSSYGGSCSTKSGFG